MWVLTLLWLLCLLLLSSIVSSCFKWWKTACGLLIASFLINWWGHIIPFHPFLGDIDIEDDHIKVLAWNINGITYEKNRIDAICNLIMKEDADVVFLSEDFYGVCDSIDSMLKLVYPYTSHDHCNDSHYFYSKYPLKGWKWIAKDIDPRSVIIKSCVSINGKYIDLYGCHLSSNNYGDGTSNLRAESVNDHRTIMQYANGISDAQDLRTAEVDVICDSISNSNNPCICLGDMNDIAGSPPFRLLASHGFNDAWWEGGFGYGATIHKPLPFRIDHIMYNEGLELKCIKKIDANGLSDHDALVATFEIL